MLLPYEDGAGAQRGRKREEAHPFILMSAIGTSADDDRSQTSAANETALEIRS